MQTLELTNNITLKLRNNENIIVKINGKICKVLDCRADDIMGFEEK